MRLAVYERTRGYLAHGLQLRMVEKAQRARTPGGIGARFQRSWRRYIKHTWRSVPANMPITARERAEADRRSTHSEGFMHVAAKRSNARPHTFK